MNLIIKQLKKMKKVSIIGAGMVGSRAAAEIARMNICDEVVLLDIKPGLAEGKAMDIMQSLDILGCYDTDVLGFTGNYDELRNSDVVVVVSGVPRKPGMSREDLVEGSANVVKSVLKSAYEVVPEAIYVIVSNPVDTMTYLAVKFLEKLGKKDAKTKVFGMGGILDSARLHYYLMKETKRYWMNEVSGYVIGGHGDTTMIPVIDEEKGEFDFDKVIKETMEGGKTLTGLLGTSAWEAAGAAIAKTIHDIICDCRYFENPFSVYREEYDACVGTMVSIGSEGIVNISKDDEDQEVLESTCIVEEIKEVNKALGEI